MITLKEYLGTPIYNILYSSEDKYGVELDDFDDLLYCDEADIPTDRVESLKPLIQYEIDRKVVFISLEASFILCAWGGKEGVEYLKYYLENYEKLFFSLGNMFPHRLHNYDTVLEKIESAIMQYRARNIDNLIYSQEQALSVIKPLIDNILILATVYEYSMMGFISKVRSKKWHDFDDKLKSCMFIYLGKKEQSRNSYWNTIDLKLLFEDRDPKFLSEVEEKYGIIGVPDSARDRL